MIADIVMTLGGLALILFSCMVFTNAVEWFGKKVHLGQGVVGSIFAAVGTALPETVIPIIAILFGGTQQSRDIGIGAIAGAPFMLGTLAFFVTGLSVIIYSLMGKRTLKMHVDLNVASRDLSYFFLIYAIAVSATFIQVFFLKVIIALVLLCLYILYLKRTFTDKCEECTGLDTLYLTQLLRVRTSLPWIVLQLLAALGGIVLGAHIFVKNVEGISTLAGISPLILSIIITPIATELPEKLNSVIWTGKGKDTLALGNITGAMVFQSCVPVVIGILFTPWHLTGITMVTAVIALAGAALNLLWIKLVRRINPFMLLFGGLLYAAFLIYTFTIQI